MSAPKLTPWVPGHIKPVRPGVYETQGKVLALVSEFQHWNGRFWGMVGESVAEAANKANAMSVYQDDKWRGLAEEPK